MKNEILGMLVVFFAILSCLLFAIFPWSSRVAISVFTMGLCGLALSISTKEPKDEKTQDENLEPEE